MTPPWSPTLALSMLLRACAAEALTALRENEEAWMRVAAIGSMAGDAASRCQSEGHARVFLSSMLRLAPADADRYIAEVYAPPPPMTEEGRREALGRAIAAEREACARIAEQVDGTMMGTEHDACARIAQGIRGRTWILY